MRNHEPEVFDLSQAWRRLLSQGLKQMQLGYYAKAVEKLEHAYREAPEEPMVLVALGRERLRQGRAEEAEALLRLAHEKEPSNATAAAALARSLGLHQGRLDEALSLITGALAQCSEKEPLLVVKGELLLELGRPLEARVAFERAQDHEITGEPARLGLARSYNLEGIELCERGEFEPAIFAFKHAANLDPEWSGPWVNLGVAFGRMGRSERSLEAYAAALEREPRNPVALFNQGTLLHEIGRLKDAAITLEDLLIVAPDYPQARAALANVLGEMKEFDRAIALFLEEIEIDPCQASSWSSLGLAYVCSGHVPKGEECLEQALALDPNHINSFFNLAAIYVSQERYEDARRVLRRAQVIDPQKTQKLLAQEKHFEKIRELL
jgi:tetratricopeptide (TPR) repeat protein